MKSDIIPQLEVSVPQITFKFVVFCCFSGHFYYSCVILFVFARYRLFAVVKHTNKGTELKYWNLTPDFLLSLHIMPPTNNWSPLPVNLFALWCHFCNKILNDIQFHYYYFIIIITSCFMLHQTMTRGIMEDDRDLQ